MPDLRTALSWLLAHDPSEDAELWVFSDKIAEPVVELRAVGSDQIIHSRPWWSEPTPVPLRWGAVYDRLLGTYSGGGTFKWASHPETFRGTYSEYPDQAIFLLFLPRETQLIESHSERMDSRREQAKQLTQEIEKSWQE